MGRIKAKAATGGIIAKSDEPVAKPVQVNTHADEIFGFFGGKGSITGDVVSPALSEEEWGELYSRIPESSLRYSTTSKQCTSGVSVRSS